MSSPRRARVTKGASPRAIPIALWMLSWLAGPGSDSRDDRVTDGDATLILVCNDGYFSSPAATDLVRMGFRHAGDLEGGFRAWAAAGLPIDPPG